MLKLFFMSLRKHEVACYLVTYAHSNIDWTTSMAYQNWPFNVLASNATLDLQLYLWNQCISPLTLWVWIPLMRDVLDTTLCGKVCQWLAAGRWFSPDTPVSDRHDITEILLKQALNTITPNHQMQWEWLIVA